MLVSRTRFHCSQRHILAGRSSIAGLRKPQLQIALYPNVQERSADSFGAREGTPVKESTVAVGDRILELRSQYRSGLGRLARCRTGLARSGRRRGG